MGKLALSSALANAAANSSITVVPDLDNMFEDKRTKSVVGALANFGVEDGEKVLLITKDLTPESDTVLMLRDKAKALGFDLSVLEPATQEGCTYPDVPGDGE